MTPLRLRPPLFALAALAALAFLAAPSAPSAAAEIVALCIGNDHYHKPEDRLDTPVADATLMAETLRAIPGVGAEDVVLLPNGTRESMERSLRQFREKARGAKLAIVFFSGHGMEDRPTGYDRAETFLLPVDAEIGNVDDLPARAVGLGDIMATFRGLPPGGRVVILDCCRTGAPSATSALAAAGKNVSEDLDARVARMLGEAELAEGTMVSFSAGPGRKALAYLQDTDAYSPFTHFLAQGIRERGGDLFTLVSEATATTREATGGRQVPRLRFDGDPSLIMAVRLPGVGGIVAPERTAADRLRGATKESPFVNSLGLEFVPVPGRDGVWMARTETRVRDFRAYASATGYAQEGGAFVMKVVENEGGGHRTTWELDASASWEDPGFEQTGDHPVVCVSWEEARAFCDWLAEQEPGLRYRLPSDAEWSAAVGSVGKYSWGNEWPAPAGSGNYSGKEMAEHLPGSGWRTAYDYDDGAVFTARVGSYRENRFGFYDLGGNVWEWCEDIYKASMNDADALEAFPVLKNEKHSDGTPFRVLRGGSWSDGTEMFLRSSRRDCGTPSVRGVSGGFRLVVVVGGGG